MAAYNQDTVVECIKVVQKYAPNFVKAFSKETLTWKKTGFNKKGILFGGNEASKNMYIIKIHEDALKKTKEVKIKEGGSTYTIRYQPTKKAKASAKRTTKTGKDWTTIQEELQCLYLAYRLKSGKELNEDNCTDVEISSSDVVKKCFFATPCTSQIAMDLYNEMEGDKKKREAWLDPNKNTGQNVFHTIANTLVNHSRVKKFGTNVHFHRHSPFRHKIYQAKVEAFENELANDKKGDKVWLEKNIKVADDKWNPADIWMVAPDVTEPFCVGHKQEGDCATLDMLKDSVIKHAKQGKILGISLKKTAGSGTVKEFNNKDREHNERTKIKEFSIQGIKKGSDFFTTGDVYLFLNNTKIANNIQLRNFSTTRGWQGEAGGSGAAKAGKITGTIINYFLGKFLKKSVGGDTEVVDWNESKFITKIDKVRMHKLYKKFSMHKKNKFPKEKSELFDEKEFIKMADDKAKEARMFYPSKWMGMLFLEAFYGDGDGDTSKHTWCSTKMMRYAMSNLDISSYYIKVG